MTVDVLEGMADFSTATIATVSWSTAADWDNAVDEKGVTHEVYGDYTDDSIIRPGYPTSAVYGGTLQYFYPCHDSGPDLVDATGTQDLFEAGAPTYDVTGPGSGTAISYDGSDDGHGIGSGSGTWGSSAWTVMGWVKVDVTGDRDNMTNKRLSGGSFTFKIDKESNDQFRIQGGEDGGQYSLTGGDMSTTGIWYFVCASADGTNVDGWLDDTQVIDQTDSRIDSQNNDFQFAGDGGGEAWPGDMSNWRYIDGYAFDDADAQGAYEVFGGETYLETATKSFSSDKTPDLQNLVYSLNGASIDLDVIGSPGTGSEEIVTQSLDGSASYTLNWSNAHQDFRLKPRFSSTDVTNAAQFSEGELVA